jgi:hypothetical protein
VRERKFNPEAGIAGAIPRAIQMTAVSLEEPGRLVQALTKAIIGGGGWVLTRSTTDAGAVNVLFEFARIACLEMYSGLVAAGVDLNQSGHRRLTELCQCAMHDSKDREWEIASIDLEIQTVSGPTQRLEPAAC